MSVVNTEKWLDKWYRDPVKLCEKLEPYFPDITASRIHEYLHLNGMYYKPKADKTSFVEWLEENKVASHIKQELNTLMKKWNGPNIPVFILPSDDNNRKLVKEYNGKSGIAFLDKLFLFVSESNTTEEIKAVFTHEYNHVCRLYHFKKPDTEYTLLDTMILEGLAENAVSERFGKKYLAPWTSYYSVNELQKFWKKILQPQANLSRQNRKHDSFLYGFKLFPKMMGYAVGYYLVCSYVKESSLTTKELLPLDSKKLI